MTEAKRGNDGSRYMMTDHRREVLRENPTHVLTDNRGNKTALLLEQLQDELHLAFAIRTDRNGVDHEVCASGITPDDAIKGLGYDIHDRYVMATTGAIPRHLRVLKVDDF